MIVTTGPKHGFHKPSDSYGGWGLHSMEKGCAFHREERVVIGHLALHIVCCKIHHYSYIVFTYP